jgi:hypothetical protein
MILYAYLFDCDLLSSIRFQSFRDRFQRTCILQVWKLLEVHLYVYVRLLRGRPLGPCTATITHLWWKYTAEPLVPDPRPFEVEIAIAKLKRFKSPGNGQIPPEILLSKIHMLINSIWNKEKVPDEWKDFIIVPIHRKGDKTDCSNYHGISLLSISYTISFNILLWRLSTYKDEIIADHQCGIWCNRSTTDQIFCICQIPEKKMGVQWEPVHQQFVDFK